MFELIAWALRTECKISMMLYPHIDVCGYLSTSLASFNICSFCEMGLSALSDLAIFLISNPSALARSKIHNQSKLNELYPAMIDGLSSLIASKNLTKPNLSVSSVAHSITSWNPLFVFIPIMNIRPSFGSSEVVSKSNTNRVMSLYSSYPLNSLFSF